MKRFFILTIGLLGVLAASAQEGYVPTEAIKKSQQEFQDDKFGIMICWGVYSILCDG